MRRYKILLPIMLAAFFLRMWQLPQTPPGLWYDEAYYSMDAAWILDGGPWRLFFVGNNGREPIFIYLQTLFIWIFGAKPLTSRLIGPIIGTLTVPLIYVLAYRLLRKLKGSWWIAIVATFSFAISFWHIGLSRSGYRGILLPLVATFLFYAFWRGWREKSPKFIVLAGVALGVSQYTYLAARVLPLVFGGYAVVSTVITRWARQPGKSLEMSTASESSPEKLKTLWVTLGIMAVISFIIFMPLGWIFYNAPSLFSARTGDVFLTPDSPTELLTHLSQAVRLFIDSGDPNWRHHLPGRPMLGWLGWLGFWPGLFICFRRIRQAPYLFLLTALLLLYLPAFLSVPPVHALRLSALLPIYYVIFALGLIHLARWAARWWLASDMLSASRTVAVIVLVVMLLEAGLTTFDYFARWSTAEETYVEYNAPLVDFVEHVVSLSDETPVIIPFQIYVHPTTRYLLHDRFKEQPAPNDLSAETAQLVSLPDNFRILNVANIPELPAFAWLTHDMDGRGVVYISRPPRPDEQAYLREIIQSTSPTIFKDDFGRELASFRTIFDPQPLLPMFTQRRPLRTISLNWANLARLDGYDVVPEIVPPNQPITINLYWRSLTDATFDQRLFLQLVDTTGQPINQWEGEAFREDMYRWRPDGILPTQHTLWLGPDTPPGPYLVRVGFFDRHTGERLPITSLPLGGTEGGQVDQIHLGLFYVTSDGSDPRTPAIPLSANFADVIQLTGVTLPDIQNHQLKTQNSKLKTVFHWQSLQPTAKPYTVFLQLLNEQGEVISSWDSQPFGGLYPTNLWSPGEALSDTFLLPLPASPGGLPPGQYRLISGFYDFETGQRLSVVGGGDFAELGEFGVE